MNAILPVMGPIGAIPGYILLRILVGVALGCFTYVLVRRFRLLCLGQADPRWSDVGARISGLVKDGILQARQPRYRAAGILHIMIFWGFVILALHTLNLLAAGMAPGFGFGFMQDGFGAAYASLKDIVELTTLAACLGALYRRLVVRPKRYQDSHAGEAILVLVFIAVLMISDFYYEGGRILMAGSVQHLLPGAWIASRTMAALDPGAVRMVHVASYWTHVVLLLVFLNLLPLSKHFHIIAALPNVFLRKQTRGQLKPVSYGSMPLAQLPSAGAGCMADFTWKHMLDFFSCTECGRCTDRCPANRIGRDLSPKGITMRLRDQAYRTVPVVGSASGTGQPQVGGGVVASDAIWHCTTCGACEAECPVFVEHVDKIADMRRHQVLMQSDFPPEFKGVFKKLETFGDTMGKGPLYREDWTSGLTVKRIYADEPAEWLFWTGCMGPLYDEQSRATLKATARLLDRSGIDWAILGSAETCCGDWARRVGNEYLFQQLADANIETFETHKIRNIVTGCPHCYNTLKHEYADRGANIEVVHIVELIDTLRQSGQLAEPAGNTAALTYHDPCYLGRYNGIYDAPRDILKTCGSEVVEMPNNRSRGFCCGAGGGNFWRGGAAGQRMENVRVEEAVQTGAKGIVTACPYCKVMLSSAVKQQGREYSFKVMDICELLVSEQPKVT